MDFTNVKCISHTCKNNDVTMGGGGGHFGGRVTAVKLKCPICSLVLMIIPMEEKYQYSITATTEEERLEERIKKAKEKSELELAKTIERIKETGN